MKKALVIGSGFGGLAVCIRLLKENYEVTLIEKKPDLGGRARVLKKKRIQIRWWSNSYNCTNFI